MRTAAPNETVLQASLAGDGHAARWGRWRLSTVRGRLLLLAAAIALPLVVLAGASVWYAYATEHDQDEVELVGRARAAALMIDREFEASQSALRVLAGSRALAAGALDAFDAEMREAAGALGGVLINLTDAAGRVVRSTSWPPGAPRLDAQASAFILDTLRGHGAQTSNLFAGPQSGQPRIGVALPVAAAPDAAPRWVLSLYPPSTRISDKLADLNLPAGMAISIIDRERRIVARNINAAAFVGRQPPPDMLLALSAGYSGLIKGDHRAGDGTPTVAAYAHAPVSGYAAIVGLPAAAFSGPLNQTLLWAGIAAAVLTALGLAGAIAVSRGIVGAFGRLAGAAPGAAALTGLREVDAVGRALAAAEAERRESEQRLNLATRAGDIGVWDWNLLDDSYICSARTRAIFGLPPGAVVSLQMAQQATHPDDRAHALAMRAWAFDLAAPQPDPFEYRILRPDGSIRHVLVHGHRVTGVVDGVLRVTRYIGTIQDVTDRKRSEQAVVDSQARLQLAIAAGRMAAWEYDTATGALVGSAAILRLLGFPEDARPTPEEVRARSAPGEHERCLAEARAARDRGERYVEVEHGFVWPDGSPHWLMLRAELVARDGADWLVGVALDITERKLSEMRAHENEAALKELLATIDLAPVFVVGGDERIQFWSRGCEALYGWSAAEATGRVARVLLRTAFPVRPAEINAVLVETGAWHGDVRHHRRDGGALTISLHLVLQKSASGGFGKILVNVRDVTALRDAEERLRLLNQQLEMRVRDEVAAREQAQVRAAQAERLQALGQLAGGIAHDFNNVLQVVGSGTTLIELQARDAARVQQIARRLQGAVERGASITRRLLVFARRGDLKIEPVNAAGLLVGLRDILTHTLGGAAAVQVQAQAGVPDMLTDRRQLETVLVNLATNARDAMPRGGTIRLGAEAVRLAAEEAGLPAGDYVAVSVADDGIGMDAATIARCVEPFFTTKATGAGTGLGLSTAFAFAQQSNGGLRIDSLPGQGTTVTLLLPVAPAASADAPAAPPAAGAPPRPASHVLVVDDDDDVREVLVAGLTEMGMRVHPAASGGAAMDWLQQGHPVDCLLTDLSMPGMNGVELVAAARGMRPGLPSIVLTGYASHEALAKGAGEEPYLVVWKPADVVRIAERIAELVAD